MRDSRFFVRLRGSMEMHDVLCTDNEGYAAGLGGEVLCVGLGHCGKSVEIAWEVRKEVC